MRPSLLAILLATVAMTVQAEDALQPLSPEYASKVAPLLTQFCAGCHNDADHEGDFSLESYASLLKGTPHGAALRPGDGEGSLIIRQLTGRAKPAMPPKDEPKPTAADVALLKAWIDAGAPGPQGSAPADRLALTVPAIATRSQTRPVTAMAVSPDGKTLATARYESVEIQHLDADGQPLTGEPPKVLTGFPGKVTAVHFSADGTTLVTASGVVGLGGVATLWNALDGSPIRRFEGHRDLLYDAELSPDGKVLATCGYDRVIQLWDAASGEPLRTLAGHNGAVYDVAFSPDGRSLVSASADDTCKLWRVADGTRLDTLPQPLKEEYACAFTPDGRSVVAGGADNSIRVWRLVSGDQPSINPMTLARFAHEGAITRLAFTADGSRLITAAEDRTLKAWDLPDFTEAKLWEHEPDVATALAVSPDGRWFRVGRIDGSTATLALPPPRDPSPSTSATAVPADLPAPPPVAPTKLAEVEPNNAIEQAQPIAIPAEVTGKIADGPPGAPDVDLFRFEARAGQEWVIDVDAARTGSKLDSIVEVLDAKGARIERVRFQATRDTYFTFRGKGDTSSADFRLFKQDEMRRDEYLYANGEVVKLWLAPRGPDSGFVVYPLAGVRWGFFDTTPLAHAVNEPCYIVEPHPPGTALIPNGLPAFPIYFENDDSAHREVGKDSRLFFHAPADGSYLVKLRDVRGAQGPDFSYKLSVRPRRPDFGVTVVAVTVPIAPGGAQEFRVVATRLDDFSGPIRIEVAGLPPGFSATTPLVIEAGQIEATGIVRAQVGAVAPTPDQLKAVTVTANATIAGADVTHPLTGLGNLSLADKPQPRITIGPAEGGVPQLPSSIAGGPPEFEIRPGQTILLKVNVERNGTAGPIPFGGDGSGRNLPFGSFIDNLGLNGLLVTETQDARTFFVTADPWVTPQTREFHLNTTAAGGHSSVPAILHVRPATPESVTAATGSGPASAP